MSNRTDTMTAAALLKMIPGGNAPAAVSQSPGNRKGHNTTQTEYDGIMFDNRVEKRMSDLLERHGIRISKIVQYDQMVGKRAKNASRAIDRVHTKQKLNKALSDDFNLAQYLFVEYLLKRYPDKIVALRESKKSGLIGTGVYPDYIGLTIGSSCGTRITQGEVYPKGFHPVHSAVQVIPVCIFGGKTITMIMVPYVYHYPDRWSIDIRAHDCKKWRTA